MAVRARVCAFKWRRRRRAVALDDRAQREDGRTVVQLGVCLHPGLDHVDGRRVAVREGRADAACNEEPPIGAASAAASSKSDGLDGKAALVLGLVSTSAQRERSTVQAGGGGSGCGCQQQQVERHGIPAWVCSHEADRRVSSRSRLILHAGMRFVGDHGGWRLVDCRAVASAQTP